jgi:hypothetical protein
LSKAALYAWTYYSAAAFCYRNTSSFYFLIA